MHYKRDTPQVMGSLGRMNENGLHAMQMGAPAGDLAVMSPLQGGGVQAVVVLRDDLLRQLPRVPVVVRPLTPVTAKTTV